MKVFLCFLLMIILSAHTLIIAQNKCLYLDGIDDFIRVSDVDDLFLSDFTLEVWIKTDGSMVGGGNILRHDDFSNSIAQNQGRDLVLFRVSNDGVVEYALREGGKVLAKGESTETLSRDRWYHLALVRNSSQGLVTLYVNGDFNSTAKLSGSQTIEPRDDLYIGAYHVSPNQWKEFFNGKIDELRIWNRALSATEIRSNIDRMVSAQENGLVLFYDFNSLTSDGRIKDISLGAHHGLLKNGAYLASSDVSSLSSRVLAQQEEPKFHPNSYQAYGTQSLMLMTSGELSKGKNYSFAGGSACCGCKIDHYGHFPSDLPKGKVSTISFFLRSSLENSYYTKKRTGPTSLKLIVAGKEAIATSEQYPDGEKLAQQIPWILNFRFSPPLHVEPNLQWQLVDGDNNIYSAVLLHSGDVDLGHGIRGYYKTYDCKYHRTEDQSYSVRFEYVESEMPVVSADENKLRPAGRIRETVYKTAVVEFTERGDLGIQDAGTIVAEWITTSLNKTNAFEVYERLSLDKIMVEHELGMSGVLDDETIAEIGRMRGVQAIITGSVIKFGNIISVTAKVIDVETAKIIDSADVKVTNVDAISGQIERLAWELAID